MTESFELIEHFNVTPDVIYNAWLDSNQHSAMTGGEAKCSDKVGNEFTAWDGYITGKNIALTPNEEIVQKWRTVEFESHHEDSDLVVELEPDNGGTKLTLIHMHIPEGQTQYKQGWIDNYFEPMKAYFG